MKHSIRRRGTFVLSGLAFFMLALVFCTFAWDTSRLLYYKIQNQNFASTVAISIVNESGHFMTDSVGKKTKGYLVTRKYTNGVRPKDFNGSFADDPSLLNYIKNQNASSMSSTDFRVTDVSVNSHYQDSYRFITGSDGVNGEVKVISTMEIDMFFTKIGGLFGQSNGKSSVTIKNIATAKPIFHATGGTYTDWNKYEIFNGAYIGI